MFAHLEENNLLNSKQHNGFQSGKICLTQLLHHFDDIIEDYAKAFDG